MSLTITDVDSVRSEGALNSPSDSAGAASDKQIQSAIRSSRASMIAKTGKELYEQVRTYSESDLTDADKSDQYDAFLHAESCFAMANLVTKLSAQQLANTGIIQSVEIGKARQSFASSEEVKKISDGWVQQANRWLAPYLAVPVDAVTQKPTSFQSRKGTLYVGAL